MSYLEFDGKDREKDTDFLGYLKVNYPLVCLAYDDICSMGTLTKEKLDSSPSVDICRSDEERLEIYLAMTGGTSTKNLIHMAQLYQSKKFQKYDYGVLNRVQYLQDEPPEIALEQITVPVALFVAREDFVADVQDNENVRQRIPNVAHYRILENEDHLSLSFSKNMTYFAEVLAAMDGYRGAE